MTGLVAFARRLGVDLWPGQVDVLSAWEASGKRRAVLRLGRRSGKDVMGAIAAIHNAVVPDYTGLLRPGETRFIFAIATREQQAREFVRVVRELLAAAPDPDLRALVDERASSADEVVFRTGVTLRALPCSSRAGRGYAVSLVVFNEAAHYISDTDGYQAFREVWRSLVPATRQFHGRGYVLALSTPRLAMGFFHDLCRRAEQGLDPDLFHVHRPTWAVNPTISRASLEPEFQSDPDGAAAEYGAEFVSGLGSYLAPEVVYGSVRRGEGRLPPEPGLVYAGSLDAAFERDATALVIAHRDLDDQERLWTVVDGCWAWVRSGFERTVSEAAAVCRAYGVHKLRADQHSARAVVEALARQGIETDLRPWTAPLKEQAFGRLRAALVTGSIELPDDEQLSSELVNLRASPLPGGGVRIAAGSGHDDRAVALAGVVDDLTAPRHVFVPGPPVVVASGRRF